MLDHARYYLALLTLLTLPWALLYWYAVHPFIHFWRRVGPVAAYVCLVGMGVALGFVIWPFRGALLATEYGTGPALWALALAAYGAAVWVELQCRKHLKFSMLVGVPEFAPQASGGKLLSEGIYGRVRHPRYVSVTFGMLAAALFCNYLAIWVLWVVTVPGLIGVVHFEESELRERFGEAYVEYSRRVPRFIPRS